MERPEASSALRSTSVGLLVGGAGAALGLCLQPHRRLDLAALELAFIAGAYPAMAFHGHSRGAIAAESAVSGLFVALAAAGLSRRSRLAIATGLVGHAAWDGVHHVTTVGARTPSWFPAFCMAADVALAVQFVRPGRGR